nr:MAG TPA: Trm112p-like protein [Caudoviricetes sp.]
MSFRRKFKRSSAPKRRRCCGADMEYKDGFYICQRCGRVKPVSNKE